jgi:hypothetical protein
VGWGEVVEDWSVGSISSAMVLKMSGSVLRIFNLTTVVFRLWMDGETSRASEISTVLFD